MAEDCIHIEGLRVSARIGVPADERARVQTLAVSVDLFPTRGIGGLGDDIGHTIDYDAAARRVREIAAAHERRLIETLAEDVADGLLTALPLDRIGVEVRKFIVPETDFVSVRLTRTRRAAAATDAGH